ncbi:MAG TPA: ABC transporter substrate-binding protein [Candidatus Binatia bacterium]|jgi:ABC-type nitrate/sulfonate/bicarbonate transport system substrate-binding protein|nr:ABC transporter substrate-binding protein [Candidatus Binatia bacterium]
MIRRVLGAGKLFWAFFVGTYLLGITAAASQSDFPIGYSSLGGTYGFIALIEEQRLLEQEGIRPTFVYIGGPQITQALVAGDIRMALVAGASPVRAAAQGAELRFIGGVTDKENITIIADSKITKPAELKGTRMAIDRLGDYTDFRARKVLERYGLEAQKDVVLLQIGGQTGRFAALRSGQVQSTFVAPPLTLIAKKAGFRSLIDLAALGFPSTSGSIVIMKSSAERSEKEVYGVMRAITRALRLFKTNRELAIRSLSRFMKVNDPEALEETFRSHAKIFQDIPVPAVAGIKMVKDFLGQSDAKVARLNVDEIVDMRFVDRLKRELGPGK